ncbi:hypothetical protein AB0I98_16895 [Streptomyces sp. NPDC050211]|uniref:hypothetical protein n=1 Tax=Streptomyces sp. NPDC050211 TaxID=3154932 RepID=UPI003412D873
MPFNLAKEAVVQVNTLASAVLALSVTFRKDLATKADETSVAILQSSWGLLILSLCSGIVALLALTGQLSKAAAGNAANLYAGGLRLFWIVQLVAFFAGMGLFGVFGIREV